MQYKLVCVDMDGTLLNSKHKVSKKSKEAIRKAYNLGVHFVISTGRMYTDGEYFSNLLGVKSPVIASNGALIKEKDRHDYIYKNVIGKSLSLKLLDIITKYKVSPTFYSSTKAYCGSIIDKLFLEFFKLRGAMSKNTKFIHVGSLRQWHILLDREKDNIIKCEIRYKDTNILSKIRSELKEIEEIEIASSSRWNIEITCKGVSKGRAVEILAAYYDIKRDEIIAIGDSENDLSMIEFAGMGVAMGNAIDIVKHRGKFVTDTNDNDGVAKAINELILKHA